jgi:drug/metabolite transporter (DMT)-like permease
MSSGLGLGLLASLLWGFVDVSAAIETQRIGSLRMLVGAQVMSVAVLVVVIAATPAMLGTDALAGIGAGLPLGVLAAAAYLTYFLALRIGPISIVSPVIVAYGGATVVLAILLRGESLAPMQGVGAGLATLGVILAAITFHGGSLRGARIVGPGIIAALATLILFAVVTVGLAAPIQDHGWLSVITGSRIANCATSAVLYLGIRRTRSSRFRPLLWPSLRPTRSTFALVGVAGVFDMSAFVAYAMGLAVAPTWLVGLASSFGPVIVVAYAVWRLGERPRSTQWLGLVLIAAGVVVLALAL